MAAYVKTELSLKLFVSHNCKAFQHKAAYLKTETSLELLLTGPKKFFPMKQL